MNTSCKSQSAKRKYAQSKRKYTHSAYYHAKKRTKVALPKVALPFGVIELVQTAEYLRYVDYKVSQGARPMSFCSYQPTMPLVNPVVLGLCIAMDIGVAMKRDVMRIKDLATRQEARKELWRHLAKINRSKYYEADNARRRKLAAERRKITKRTTTAPQPDPEQILEAWNKRKESKEAMIRLGGLLQDLECYVDNTLKINEFGDIVGRKGGIHGWLKACLPELALKYKTLMRYKAMAKKLRQVTATEDPTPTETLLTAKTPHPVLNEIYMRKSLRRVATGTFAAIEAVLDEHLKPMENESGIGCVRLGTSTGVTSVVAKGGS